VLLKKCVLVTSSPYCKGWCIFAYH
jgi:hypothetical protein